MINNDGNKQIQLHFYLAIASSDYSSLAIVALVSCSATNALQSHWNRIISFRHIPVKIIRCNITKKNITSSNTKYQKILIM